MNKIFFYTAFALLTLVSGHSLSAQNISVNQVENSIKKHGKYALLVRKAQHLKAGIMTGEQLLAQHPGIDFQIVVCGELVKTLATDEQLRNAVTNGAAKGLHILSCGLSLKQFETRKDSMPAGMQYTENGLIYIFGLEENGYKTITL